jgi:hypothetical protein
MSDQDEITRLRAELADARRKAAVDAEWAAFLRKDARQAALEDARDIALAYAGDVAAHGHLHTDPLKAAAQASREIASSILALAERTP